MGKSPSLNINYLFSFNAIMRGAVLHKSGSRLVKWRIMRVSYDFAMESIFMTGQHPEQLKFRDKVDGNFKCKDVMR